MAHDIRLSTKDLLAHSDWIEHLARRLIFDASRAEDLVQATWLEALERPPRDTHNLRGWLATVARHAARKMTRNEQRRRRREASVARPDRSPDVSEVLDKAVLQRDLATHVIALEEPLRPVVLLRYFDGLSTTEIAKRLNRPRNTVQTQLQRGLERLRKRLDKEHGSRESWGLALLPLVDPRKVGASLGSSAAATAAGTWALGLFTTMAATVTALLALAWSMTDGDETREMDGKAPMTSSADVDESSVSPVVQQRGQAAQRVELSAHSQDEEPSGINLESNFRFEGLILDVEGAPVPGVAVSFSLELASYPRAEAGEAPLPEGFQPGKSVIWVGSNEVSIPEATAELLLEHLDDPEGSSEILGDFLAAEGLVTSLEPHGVVSDGDGRVALDVPLASTPGTDQDPGSPWKQRLELADDRWCLIGSGTHESEEGELLPALIVAPKITIAGRVVSPENESVAGVEVKVSLGSSELASVPIVAETTPPRVWSSTTDSMGRFTLVDIPGMPGLTLEASLSGYYPQSSTLTDATGRFEQDLRSWSAAMPGDPVVINPDDVQHWLEVLIGGNPEPSIVLFPVPDFQIIEGRVLHADGTAADQTSVSLGGLETTTDDDGHFRLDAFDLNPSSSLVASKPGFASASRAGFAEAWLEDSTIGKSVLLRLGPPSLTIRGRVVDAQGTPCRGMILAFLDSSMAGTLDSLNRPEERTASDGSFELTGLAARDYTVLAVDPLTGLLLRSGLVPAGTHDLELAFPPDPRHPFLQGRVVDLAGQSVPNAHVQTGYYLFRGERSSSRTSVLGVHADEQGLFRLEEVPRQGVFLEVSGPRLERTEIDIEAIDTSGTFELRVKRVQDVRVDPGGSPDADAYEFRAATGEVVTARTDRLGRIYVQRRIRIDRSQGPLTHTVSEEAVEIALFRGGKELRTLSLEFHADGVWTLRP